ncbi:MAG: DNA alkylation repair protein [Candidatus Gastranaerophilales bacterium]|nr:DNA alkylation repair protein [Candidatus Gastranaerophilales bacterium]
MKLMQVKKELDNIKRTKFGISIPELRKFAKKLAKENYKEFIEHNDYSSFELKMLHAFLIGYLKDDINTLLKYFKDFIPYVDDWAVNDSLCQNFRIARKYPDTVWNFLLNYKNSKKEFESRIVAVVLLSHYLNDEYIDRVIEVINSLNTDDYYSQMGTAWAVATIMGKYPEKCLEYLKSEKCNLDKITYNKSLQKIKESYRVSDKMKLITNNLKKL